MPTGQQQQQLIQQITSARSASNKSRQSSVDAGSVCNDDNMDT